MEHKIQVLNDDSDIYSVLKKIVNEGGQNEGFCICDLSEIVKKFENWKQYLPNIFSYYAIKCNDTKLVLETLVSLGIGFSCHSKEEIRRIISLGVSPEKIIFANPTKKIKHIIYAAELGVKLTVFDNEEELYKIKKYHPLAQLILRISITKNEANGVFNRKYGAESEAEIKQLLFIAKQLSLDVIGVAAYCSDQNNVEEYSKLIKTAKNVFDIALNFGYTFKLLDIGDEFSGKDDQLFYKTTEVINNEIKNNFPDNELNIIAEPGRYYVETAFKTMSYIHSKAVLDDNTRMYYLDLGLYNGLFPLLNENQCFQFKSLNNHSTITTYPSILWGPTCDSADKISKDVDYLPDLEIGEWIVFENSGAYSLQLTYEFNGFSLPNIHCVVKHKYWLSLTNNVPRPLEKSKFVSGDFIENYLTGLNVPYVYLNRYG